MMLRAYPEYLNEGIVTRRVEKQKQQANNQTLLDKLGIESKRRSSS